MKKFLFTFFGLLFAVFIFLSSGIVDAQDGFQYLAVSRNIYYQHEPTAPVYEFTGGVNVAKNIHLSTHTGKDGKTYSSTGLGYSLAMLPAVFLTDLVYHYYQLTPSIHFPLESDWLILMLTSFINGFFASILGIFIFLFLLEIKLNKNQAILITLISLFATNLLAYAKSTYAHMMFTTLLFIAFYFIRKYAKTGQKKYLFFSGLSYGANLLTYNQTTILSIIPFLIYLWLLLKPKINTQTLRIFLNQLFIFLIGFLPFLIAFLWYQKVTTPYNTELVSTKFYTSYAKGMLGNLPISSIFEGLYGQLLSPGRSIFLYSPILLLPLFFWHKLKKDIFPELLLLISLSLIYIPFYSTLRSFEEKTGFIGYWSGELSWGPRYLLPLVPFGMLIVGHIYKYLTKKSQLFFFYPLVVFGLYVSLLGTIVPFQTKLHGLETDIYISGQHYTSFLYMNLLPKFSPLLSHSKRLQYNLVLFPKTLNHGIYKVKFFDGFDFPFQVGTQRWRTIEDLGLISFDNSNNQIKKISIDLINHPLTQNASSSAYINLELNQKQLLPTEHIIKLGKKETIEANLNPDLLQPSNNQMRIFVRFDQPNAYKSKDQLLAMTDFSINNQPINIETLDFPYLSSFGPVLSNQQYQNYGNLNPSPWKGWDIHTQIFERVPDFWWIKSLYYWDFPKNLFLTAFIFNISLILFLAFLTLKFFKKIPNKK